MGHSVQTDMHTYNKRLESSSFIICTERILYNVGDFVQYTQLMRDLTKIWREKTTWKKSAILSGQNPPNFLKLKDPLIVFLKG